MAERELEFTTRLTREDVAGVVEAFVEGLKDGRLVVKKSGETLELEVPRVIDLEIEAKVTDEKAEFEIEISWRTNRAENPDNAPEDAEQEACPEPVKTEKAAKPAAKKAAPAKKTAKPAAKRKTAAKSTSKKPAKSKDGADK